MEPTSTFSVPSLHDGTVLECRVFYPDIANAGRKGAIVAHPYAPLGGSFNDPVVGIVTEQLRKAGYIVGTFNFRGAGNSKGKTSWTANPELMDYISFAGFFVLHLLQQQTGAVADAAQLNTAKMDQLSAITLIYAGYSFGALVASRMIPPQKIFTNERIAALDQSLDKVKFTHGRSLAFRQPQGLSVNQTSTISTISTRYLLISPVLGPVQGLLTLFTRGSTAEEEIPKLTQNPTLAIFGTNDAFTLSSTIHKWAERLSNASGSQFHFVEVPGAGHFWHEPNAISQLQRSLEEWSSDVQFHT